MKKYALIMQFLPLSLLVIIAKIMGLTFEAWSLAFQVSGVAALIQVSLFMLLKLSLNSLLVGVNSYLIVGGLSLVLGVESIWNLYGEMRESALFATIFIVGLISTFSSPQGFIEVESTKPENAKKFSIYLLIITALCLGLSILYKGNVWLAGTLPFILLFISRKRLQMKAKALEAHS